MLATTSLPIATIYRAADMDVQMNSLYHLMQIKRIADSLAAPGGVVRRNKVFYRLPGEVLLEQVASANVNHPAQRVYRLLAEAVMNSEPLEQIGRYAREFVEAGVDMVAAINADALSQDEDVPLEFVPRGEV